MIQYFLKGISPKVNVVVQLEFELAFYDTRVQHISHYVMETSSLINFSFVIFFKVMKRIATIKVWNLLLYTRIKSS